MKHILVTGNPVTGFTFYGPFDTANDAGEAGDKLTLVDWWVGQLWPFEQPGVDATL